MKRRRKPFWFWASILDGFVKKSDVRKTRSRCVIHENLVLIQASSAREALSKAQALGRFSERLTAGLTLSGKLATRIFFGISGMGIIYEKLGDGAEITWTRRYCTLGKARKIGMNRSRLLRTLTKEFNLVERIGVCVPMKPPRK
jgi:hypothetical protein